MRMRRRVTAHSPSRSRIMFETVLLLWRPVGCASRLAWAQERTGYRSRLC